AARSQPPQRGRRRAARARAEVEHGLPRLQPRLADQHFIRAPVARVRAVEPLVALCRRGLIPAAHRAWATADTAGAGLNTGSGSMPIAFKLCSALKRSPSRIRARIPGR